MRMTKKEREHASKVAALGCVVCGGEAMIHHCGTGGGGRKDHSKIIGLCHTHHQGELGIHTLSRRVWREMFDTEENYLQQVEGDLYE